MANRGPHGKAPVGAGRGKMDFKVLGRLMKQVFHDYPVHLTVVLVCIVLTALINVAPAAYIETITSYIEEGLGSGWDAILPKLLSALVTMTTLYVVNIILTTVYTQLMAHVTQGFLHKTRERMFSTMQRLPSPTLTARRAATSCPASQTTPIPCVRSFPRAFRTSSPRDLPSSALCA